MSERRKAGLLIGVFLIAYYLPLEHPRFQQALLEGFYLLRDYAREHVLLCLVPAFFIAGAIAAFLSQASVLRYLGPQAPRVVAYGVAATSGTALAVCSCTVLPLFAGIYKRGAGWARRSRSFTRDRPSTCWPLFSRPVCWAGSWV